jgi:hypothetical protein
MKPENFYFPVIADRDKHNYRTAVGMSEELSLPTSIVKVWVSAPPIHYNIPAKLKSMVSNFITASYGILDGHFYPGRKYAQHVPSCHTR